MRFPWFFNEKKKKIQLGDPPGSIGKVGVKGGELNVNPNTDITLERAKGRLGHVEKSIVTRSDNDPKKARLIKTREKLKALVFILTDDD